MSVRLLTPGITTSPFPNPVGVCVGRLFATEPGCDQGARRGTGGPGGPKKLLPVDLWLQDLAVSTLLLFSQPCLFLHSAVSRVARCSSHLAFTRTLSWPLSLSFSVSLSLLYCVCVVLCYAHARRVSFRPSKKSCETTRSSSRAPPSSRSKPPRPRAPGHSLKSSILAKWHE